MRRYLLTALTLLSVFVSVFFISCDNSPKEPEKVTYTVTFDYGYEVEKTVKEVTEGDTLSKPSDPERTGYTFKEWQKDGKPYDFSTAVTGDITLIAKWTINTYTITFDPNGGTPASYSEVKVEYDKLLTEPTAPTKEGNTFLGWYDGDEKFDFENTKITKDYNLKAMWSFYTVKINYYDSTTPVESKNVDYGKLVEKPDDPAETEWGKFEAWCLYDEETETFLDEYNFNTPVTSDIYLAARWNYKTYTVTFDTDEGTPASYPDQTGYCYFKAKNPGTPTRDGYNFLGWYNGDKEFNFNIYISQDYNLKAKWEKKVFYTVSFNSDGGTEVSPQTIEKDGQATSPDAPTKTGYTFKEWQKDGVKYDFSTAVTGDITLTAAWTINQYKVTFDTDGGSPSYSEKTVDYNTVITNPGMPTKTGYTFKEWQKDGKAYDFSTAVTGDITLIAKWTANKYTITFDPNGGTPASYSEVKVEYDKLLTEPTAPTKEGNTFLGWYDGDEKFDFENTKITKDYNLKAMWAEKVYHTVNLRYYWGNTDTYQVESGTTFPKPADPDETEWGVFEAWYLYDDETEWAEDEYDFSTPVTSDITIAGWWKYKEYTVTFDTDGGDPASYPSQTVECYDCVYNPGTPTKDGYNFIGWYYGENKFDFKTEITQNYDLIAKWEEKTYYTLSFNSNGGTDVAYQTIEEGGKATKPDDPVYAGHYLHVWVYSDDETRIFDFDNDTITGNIILKAVWKEPYNIGDKGPAGGWIFYDAGSTQKSTYKDSSGNDVTYYWRYLEAAPADITITEESANIESFIFGYKYDSRTKQSVTVGAQSKDIGSGRSNTRLLVNAMGTEAYEINDTSSSTTDRYAAKLCDDYIYENGGETYDDWFLPSLNELSEIYNNLYKATTSVGGFEAAWYWSSSEESTNSYAISFNDGGNHSTYRKGPYRVRPVRAL